MALKSQHMIVTSIEQLDQESQYTAARQLKTFLMNVNRPVLLALIGVAALALAVGAEDTAWFQPLTRERIGALPAAEQRAWLDYLERSQKLFAEEKQFRADEARAAGLRDLKLAPYAAVFGANLNQRIEWFATPEGRRVTVNILSYQTPSGGWSKRLDLGKEPRAPGTDFVSESNAHYEGTFDNDSTTTQLRAVAKAFKATGSEAARAAFMRGLNYIFNAQYPNGGWPQIYPLEGGYHDAIPYNDNVMTNILTLLTDIAAGTGEFDFVSADLRRQAAERVERGVAAILASQVRVNGQLTAWGQQHDALTLKPCGARNYEPAGLSSSESAPVMGYLMTLPKPSPAVVASIEGAAAWLKASTVTGFAWRNVEGKGRLLVAEPGAGALWSRLYEIGSNRPIFGKEDRTVLYDVSEVSLERRNGYSWYGNGPARYLEQYRQWNAARSANPNKE
jgi:PelA/Pel-15E family pectate lyase